MQVWSFDPNHRVYKRDGNGRSIGGPIWREHWRPIYVLGETSRSWLVGPEWMKSNLSRASKVPKRDWPGTLAVSEDEIDRRAFVENRYQLAQRIQGCRDYDTLKKIEAILASAQPSS